VKECIYKDVFILYGSEKCEGSYEYA